MQSLIQQSESNLAQHTGAIRWRTQVSSLVAVAWLESHQYYATMQAAVHTLFAGDDFPSTYTQTELRYERDLLGKPYIDWEGRVSEWANACGIARRCLHISNTHDGGAHIVVAAYGQDLVGLGIDAVYLPRLSAPEKDAVYLRRFAARFMSAREKEAFDLVSAQEDIKRDSQKKSKDSQQVLKKDMQKDMQEEIEEEIEEIEEIEKIEEIEEELAMLRLRVAAHFSLMEAASKACGTGLKVGAGMGRVTSLPKQSLGVLALTPDVELLFEGDALARLALLGARRAEAYWSADETFLTSVVLLWR